MGDVLRMAKSNNNGGGFNGNFEVTPGALASHLARREEAHLRVVIDIPRARRAAGSVALRLAFRPQAFTRNQSRQSETVWAACAPMPVCSGEFPHDAASEWGATPREHQ